MKKVFLCFVMAFLMLFTSFAEITATLGLTASVAQNISVALSSDMLNFPLNGYGNGDTATTNLTIISNVKNWTVTISSVKLGVLKNSNTALSDIPYKISSVTPESGFTGTNNISTAVQLLTGATIIGTTKTKKEGIVFPILLVIADQASSDILYDAAEAGTFTDTITFTIAAP